MLDRTAILDRIAILDRKRRVAMLVLLDHSAVLDCTAILDRYAFLQCNSARQKHCWDTAGKCVSASCLPVLSHSASSLTPLPSLALISASLACICASRSPCGGWGAGVGVGSAGCAAGCGAGCGFGFGAGAGFGTGFGASTAKRAASAGS